MKIFLIFVVSCLLMSCAGTMRAADKDLLYEIDQCGYDNEEYGEINVHVAGALNVLPGVGNFYLAVNSDEDFMWVVGALNLITWPYSIIWGVPEVMIDARTINRKETVKYYRFSKKGKERLGKCRGESKDNPIVTQEEYQEIKRVKIRTDKEVILQERSYFEDSYDSK